MITALVEPSRIEGSSKLTLAALDEERATVQPIVENEMDAGTNASEEDTASAVLRLVRFLEHQNKQSQAKKVRAEGKRKVRNPLALEHALRAYRLQSEGLGSLRQRTHLIDISA